MMRQLRRLLFLLRREDDVAAELEFHRQMKEEELRARGVAENEIRSATQRAIGNDLQAREQSRDVWIPPWLQDITQDMRFGVRMLSKDRRFTIAAITALALGIAVNSAVFTILNTAFWRALPFEESHRLVDLRLVAPRGPGGNLSPAEYREWRAVARSFEELAAHGFGSMNVSEPGHATVRLRGTWSSANTFAMLRVQPILGRAFQPGDDQAGAPAVALIAHQVWVSRYAGDPSAIGRTIRINEVPTVIVGVMPPGFAYPAINQVWMPLSQMPGIASATRTQRTLGVVGRLAAGASITDAQAELDSLAAATAQAHPDSNKDHRVVVSTIRNMFTGGAPRVFLATLMGAVGFVLLIACANVASLLLARSTSRSREIAIRSSLGASRWRIVRQTLVECTAIAVVAGAVGFALSLYAASFMSRAFDILEFGSPGTPIRPFWVDISPDRLGWFFLGLLCLVASLGIGLLPAWHLSRTDANDILKDGGRLGGAIRAHRWNSVLLVAQIAVTLVLLTGAGLLVRAHIATYQRDFVIDPANVVTMRVDLPPRKYQTPDARRQFVEALEARLPAIDVFESIAVASDIPLLPSSFTAPRLTIDRRPWPEGDTPPTVTSVTVGPRYFETLKLPVPLGRSLQAIDALPGQEGVVVNERFAARFLSQGEVLGARIKLTSSTVQADAAPWLTVVGVARTLPVFIADRDDEPVVYVPFAVEPAPGRGIVAIVRAHDAAGRDAAASLMRDEVKATDPDLPIFAVWTMDDIVVRSRITTRTVSSWFLTLAAIALTLASVGLYALTAHGVAQRTHEIGVRIALGARAAQIVGLFLRRVALQLALGVGLGVVGALATGQLLSAFIGRTNPRDPLTIAVVSVLLIVIAFIASVVPARKAARVNPVQALRAD